MTLQDQIKELEAKEADILSHDTIDQDALNVVRNKLAELRDEEGKQQVTQQINQNHEDRVTQASSDFADFLRTLDVGGGLTLKQIVGDEGDYQLLAVKLQRGFAAQAVAFSDQIKGYEEQVSQLQRQNDNLQSKLSASDTDNGNLKLQVVQLQQQLSDAETKRDAAAAELAEVKRENEQFKKQTSPTSAVPSVDPEQEARLELDAKAKRLVYNVQPVEAINPKNYTATLAATGEAISYNWIKKNYYIEVTQEEALQFRTTYEAATGKPAAHDSEVSGQVPAAPEVPAVEPVAQFPEAEPVQTPSATDTVVRETEAQGHSDVVSRAEIDTINKRLDRLEKQAGLNTLEVA